jgi:putative GTP pyrophosphokinase
MTGLPNLPEEVALVDELLPLFRSKRSSVENFLNQVSRMFEKEIIEGGRLHTLVHSTKSRVKDEEHLRKKILRKLREGRAKGEPYEVTKENFFSKINDLAAYRIMHLHPRQMEFLHPVLMALFAERRFGIFEDPGARVWDLETEKFYRETVGLKVVHTAEKLYSSVHYIVESNSTTKYTCEIQVRTLSDEVWGEVDHKINYPVPVDSVACREQIKALAHVTTSCNRLVDSIFASHSDLTKKQT